jgi:hypothetical protein
VRLYPNDRPDSNLLEPIPLAGRRWTLRQRLAFAREENHRTSSGRGVARRTRHELQLDEGLELLAACAVQGAVVRVGTRGHIVRGKRDVRVGIVALSPEGERSAAVRAYRAKAAPLIEWLHTNGPRAGWALPMKKKRPQGKQRTATWYLPRRSYSAFYAWRRVLRRLASLLVTLDTFWELLLAAPSPSPERAARPAERPAPQELRPVPRVFASTAKPERRRQTEASAQREPRNEVKGSVQRTLDEILAAAAPHVLSWAHEREEAHR